MNDRDFERLMEGVADGSEDAAWELVTTYGDSLRRAVRRVLNGKFRSKFDSLDFVQIVWKSFFQRPNVCRRCDSPEKLAAFLVAMARNKVHAEVRQQLKWPGHDPDHEQELNDSIDGENVAGGGQDPLPIDVAIAKERWDQLLHDQPERYRKIIGLKLRGHSCQSIGVELKIDSHTVRRFLNRLLLSTADP